MVNPQNAAFAPQPPSLGASGSQSPPNLGDLGGEADSNEVSIDLCVHRSLSKGDGDSRGFNKTQLHIKTVLEAIDRNTLEPAKVITADMDYAVVPGIQVFTSDGLVLEQAKLQGKLLTR